MADKKAPEKVRVILARGATPINEGGVVNMGVHAVMLPGKDEQAAGFELSEKDTKRLLTQFPDRYKRMLTEGASQHQQEGQDDPPPEDPPVTIVSPNTVRSEEVTRNAEKD